MAGKKMMSKKGGSEIIDSQKRERGAEERWAKRGQERVREQDKRSRTPTYPFEPKYPIPSIDWVIL